MNKRGLLLAYGWPACERRDILEEVGKAFEKGVTPSCEGMEKYLGGVMDVQA